MATEYFWTLWDCSDCGLTKISGQDRECPRCGSPNDPTLTPEEQYYMSDNPALITDAEGLARAKSGKSWNCGNCQTQNDGTATKCRRCDEPRGFNDTVNREYVYDEQASRYDSMPDFESERIESDLARAERAIGTEAAGPRELENVTRPLGELPKKGRDTDFYDDIRDGVYEAHAERQRMESLPPFMRFLHQHVRVVVVVAAFAAIALIVSLIVGIVKWVQYETATAPGTVTVAELHWERQLEVEEYKTLSLGDWSHPGDARIKDSERRIRTYRTVHDRWETEWYTDYETRYKSETYTDYESRPRTVTVPDTCTRTTIGSNGTAKVETYSCSKTQTTYDRVPVQRTRQVPYQEPVRKTRQIEITHQEPVWDTWYEYDVDRWVTDRWVVKTDSDNPKPFWPEATDTFRNEEPGDQVGEERIGDERRERYTIVYTDAKGKNYATENSNMDLWSKLEQGETIPALYYQKNGELKEDSIDWASVN